MKRHLLGLVLAALLPILGFLAPVAVSLAPTPAAAQSGCQYMTYGTSLTPAMWQSCWASKQNYATGQVVGPSSATTGNAACWAVYPALSDCGALPSVVAGTNVTVTKAGNAYTVNSTLSASGANPTATVGATAVNGVATTFMRSDAAPPLAAGAALANLGGAGQFTATATNDNAAAGKVGEYICAQVTNGGSPTGCATNTSTPVSLPTATTTNVASISLTAGDWDVWANEQIVTATGTTAGGLVAAITTTSATLPTAPAMGAYSAVQPAGVAGGLSIPAGMMRVSIASTTTVYLVGFFTYTGGATTVGGFIGARRAR